jgi:hypothetical protein
VTYDSIHAALVAQNGIEVVVTEDVSDWSKIMKAWPKVKKTLNVNDIIIVSPTKGECK